MITIIGATNAVILGLLASLSPCLFPVLPTFVAYLTNQETNRKMGLLLASAVTLGIMTIFVILALSYNSLISFLNPNYLLFRTWQGIILLVLGLLLIVGFSLNWNMFDRLNQKADGIIQKISNPWLTAYFIGLSFTLLAAPCAFIVFATAFTLAAGYSGVSTIAFMALFSIGAGLPFFVIGGSFTHVKERLIQNRHTIEKYVSIVAGIIIMLIGTYLTLDGMKLL